MKHGVVSIIFTLSVAIPTTLPLWSQANAIPSASPASSASQATNQDDQRGRQLIDQMIAALGGKAWLNRRDVEESGRTAGFFQGQPNGYLGEFKLSRQFGDATHPEALRIGFLTERGMIMPGKKIDVVQIWKDKTGYEVTYKGKTTLPKDQIEDFYRRRAHSIEAVVHDWIKAPGVMILADGTSMVERRMADKVTILGANNDAVTIELDSNTHLPLRSSFQWRNPTFNDFDHEVEEYDDYHTIQGLPTAFALTHYHDGEMTGQTFLIGVQYNTGLSPDLFNPDLLLKKK